MAQPKTEGDILRAISRIGIRGPESLTEEDYERLLEWVSHPDPRVRKEAVSALELFSLDWSPAPAVMERLPLESDPEVKAQVIDTLVLLGCEAQEQAEAMLLDEEAAVPDYDEETPEWYDKLRDALPVIAADEAEAEPVRASAIAGLGEMSDDPKLRGTWLPYLESPNPALRAAALKAVGYFGDPTGVEETILAGMEDPHPLVRKWALLAAGNTHLEAAAGRIRPLLDAGDPEVQGDAWYAFVGTAPLEEARALVQRLSGQVDEEDPRFGDLELACDVLDMRTAAEEAGVESDETSDEEEPAETAAPAIAPVRRATPKVGRNEPCPCGSGKKYKKCCGA